MSDFTADYLARLGTWAVLAAGLEGGLVWLSWIAWARATRAARPELRHRLACLHFAALGLLPIFTLAILQSSVQASVSAMAHASRCDCARPTGLWLGVYAAARRLAWPAALIWAAGAAVGGAWLALGVWGLRRVRGRPASSSTVEEVGRLALRWPIRAAPEVREADVDAPQVIGLRRPVLLLPLRFAETLAPAEREAVLLHELAHVARADFGWNLAQRLTLALLWPHPVAWLLYRRLRREREIRCDALAIGRGATAAALGRALLRLAQDRTSQAGLSMALSDRSDLPARLRRLAAPADKPAKGHELRLAALAASAACILALGLGRLGLVDPMIGAAYVASAFGPTVSIAAHDRAGTFSLDIRHGRVIAASLGTSRLPANRIRQQGRRVVLIGPALEQAVSLTVSPDGEVRWSGRS